MIEVRDFESGLSGDSASASNTGFSAVVVTGGPMTIDDSWAISGSRSLRMVGTGTASSALYGWVPLPATDDVAMDLSIKYEVLPTSEQALVYFGGGSGTTRNSFLAVMSNGALRWRDSANGDAWMSATGLIQAGRVYRIAAFMHRDAAAGSFHVVVYDGDTDVVLVDSGLITGKNTGSSETVVIRVGLGASSGTITGALNLDRLRFDPTATEHLPSPNALAPLPALRWDASEGYVRLGAFRWNGTAYEAILVA